MQRPQDSTPHRWKGIRAWQHTCKTSLLLWLWRSPDLRHLSALSHASLYPRCCYLGRKSCKMIPSQKYCFQMLILNNLESVTQRKIKPVSKSHGISAQLTNERGPCCPTGSWAKKPATPTSHLGTRTSAFHRSEYWIPWASPEPQVTLGSPAFDSLGRASPLAAQALQRPEPPAVSIPDRGWRSGVRPPLPRACPRKSRWHQGNWPETPRNTQTTVHRSLQRPASLSKRRHRNPKAPLS